MQFQFTPFTYGILEILGLEPRLPIRMGVLASIYTISLTNHHTFHCCFLTVRISHPPYGHSL